MKSTPTFAYAAAILAPVVVASALVSVRGDLDSANSALLIVLVVVLVAALGGRGPAVVSALVGALSWEFFFTKPYNSLRIDSANDVETTLILLVIGLVVGQVAVVGRQRHTRAERGRDELARVRRVAEAVAAGVTGDELVTLVCDQLRGLLGLLGCHFEPGTVELAVPALDRNGHVDIHRRVLAGDDFALPAQGVRIPVSAGGREIGSLLLEPDPAVGVSVEQRLAALALADQLASALVAPSARE